MQNSPSKLRLLLLPHHLHNLLNIILHNKKVGLGLE